MATKRSWLLLCLCLGLGLGLGSGAGKAEIEKLRSELNAALEAGEEAHGVIVQPSWTKGKVAPPAAPSQVIADKASLSETAALRGEIQQAVAAASYAKAAPGNAQQVQAFETALAKKGGGSKGAAPGVGVAQAPMLGGSQAEPEQLPNQPNVVDSALISSGEIDLEQLHQLELSKRRSREMLILTRIVEDLSFTLGADVEQWAHMRHNGSVYFVGRRSADLLLVEVLEAGTAVTYEPRQTLPNPGEQPLTVMLAFERWDPVKQLQEGIILVAVQTQLLWYRQQSANDGFALGWDWQLGSRISSVQPFSLEDQEYLAVASNRTLRIYAYDLANREFWIAQRLQFDHDCANLALLDTGRDLLLAVAQADQAKIYAYNPRSQRESHGELHLRLLHSVESPKIDHIAAFQMGGRSYLALGGQRPQILHYNQGKLEPRTILGQNFGLVELFLPLPVRTYRDDLLLLVQHRVAFDTHELVVLETLVWNGEAFEASVPAPCQLGDQPAGVHGVACMLDIERDAGLKGSALLRQQETPLLLVPRHDAESGLFRLHTQLLPRNSELRDLQEIYDFMRRWLAEQDALVKRAEQLLTKSPASKAADYELVSTPQLINEGAELRQLLINDVAWTSEDAGLDLRRLLQHIRLLEGELSAGRVRRQLQLFHYDYEQLDFDELEADELLIKQLNHARFYVENATLNFAGTLNVEHLEVSEATEEEQQEQALPTVQRLQRLNLTGDLDCDFINGLPWLEFEQQLVWRQQPMELPQLEVLGAVVFEQSLRLAALNELSFPGDYLCSQANATSIVRAPKIFTQMLSANAVDIVGTINGVDPEDAITLSDSQDWPGLVTFTQLEVSEQLELHGRAQGRQLEQAPPNPTLVESREIHAHCHFAQLELRGPLLLQGLLDNDSYDSLLGDLAQRPADAAAELSIPSAKHFQRLELPVDTHIEDGQLNGIPIEHFITRNTPQTLHNLSSIDGYVYFHELNLTGGFDGVHIDELLKQGLRIDEPLKAPTSTLNFVEGGDALLADLQLTQRLNDVPLSSYQLLHSPLYLNSARFQRLAAPLADIAGQVTGAGRLNGRNLSQLMSQPSFSGDVYVQELILPSGVQVARLNGIDANLLLDFLQQLDELPLLVLAGKLQVRRILVSGSVHLADSLNGRLFTELQRELVRLDQPNELLTRWSFEEPPHFAANLQILGTFNDRLLPELIEDIVFRTPSATPIVIVGPKSFQGPVRVLGQLQLEALNGVPFNRLANKRLPMVLDGDLLIQGNLHVDKLQLATQQQQQLVNGEDWSELERLLIPIDGALVQRGLQRLPSSKLQLADLTVGGHLGSRNDSEQPLGQFLDELLHRSQAELQLSGHKIFTGRVSIEGGAQIGQLNGLPLAELLQQLIFLDGGGGGAVDIHTPVVFEAAVQLRELRVGGSLVLPNGELNGCPLSEWLAESVRVDAPWQADRRLTFALGALDQNALQARYLNGLELSRVLTLHSEQNLSAPLLLDELHLAEHGSLKVGGSVNDVDLPLAYANTLMTNSPHPQTVETPLLMQSLHVSGALQALAPINGDPNLNLSDVATATTPELKLRTPLYFAALHAPQLRTWDQISGFDFAEWHRHSLWARGRPLQRITGNWSVRMLKVKHKTPQQQLEMLQMERSARQTLEEEQQLEEQQSLYPNLCSRLQRVFGWLQRRLPYQVKQLERRFELRQAVNQPELRRSFALSAKDKNKDGARDYYLLLNERGCWTRVYRWNGSRFAAAGSFESGPVDDVVALQVDSNSSGFHFMTSSQELSEAQLLSWNCSSERVALQTWRVSKEEQEEEHQVESLSLPLSTLSRLQQQRQLQQRSFQPSYQRAVKYLPRPTTSSTFSAAGAQLPLSQDDYKQLVARLLQDLSFRLQTEVNITQLSIPESDLYDDQLLEDFLALMQTLQSADSMDLTNLPLAELPLPDTPARVLAARSVQLIWPVLEELRALHKRGLAGNQSEATATVQQSLSSAVRDVLLLANGAGAEEQVEQLHKVIERLRQLLLKLKTAEKEEEEMEPAAAASEISRVSQEYPLSAATSSRIVQTLRLCVGAAANPRLLYARLIINAIPLAPSSAPAGHIQLHHANGSLFQSLAVDHTARQLTELRVRDETLLVFAERCCRVRVLIYRGVQGFVPFAQFEEAAPIIQLLAMRLPLNGPPGALYLLGVAQARKISFYELVVVGLFEPWLRCE